MPTYPAHSKFNMVFGKRLGRTLSDDEVFRLAVLARALKLRRNQQMIYKPRMEICDDGDSPLITATFELPGLRHDQVAVDVVDGRLIVSGERRQQALPDTVAPEHSDACVLASASDPLSGRSGILQVRELKYGFFRRVVAVPPGCTTSDLEATLEHGMLTVSWPRHPLETMLCDKPSKDGTPTSTETSVHVIAGRTSSSRAM